MKESKIIVTGCAGFIGYHLTQSLIKDNIKILGIDNLNDYYDIDLKKARLNNLVKYNEFSFEKMDIANKNKLELVFKKFKPTIVVNLAAQAGVRYSVENPYAYLDANISGFLNILECCRHSNVEGLIYASSSSVYGTNKNIPFSIKDKTDKPASLYAATKKANELMAHSYSHLYGLHTTGLRYFTVYGPWGRPDMALYIFTEKIIKGKPITVFNYGDMKRDFTYIQDIIKGTRSAIENNYFCEVFNLGNHKSEKLMNMINIIEETIGKKAEISYQPMQKGDVPRTFADIDTSIDKLGYSPTTNISIGIPKFIHWFMKYYNIKES